MMYLSLLGFFVEVSIELHVSGHLKLLFVKLLVVPHGLQLFVHLLRLLRLLHVPLLNGRLSTPGSLVTAISLFTCSNFLLHLPYNSIVLFV